MTTPHVLVIGAGSVGRRHLRNFAALGCRVAAMDPRADRLDEAHREVALTQADTTLEAALAHAVGCDGVVVASPPSFHVAQCTAALERGLPVLLEKPVSPTLAEASHLATVVRQSGRPLLLGYTYRWWPPLQRFRERLQQGEIGRVLHVRCVMSAHLADWHPWERYQDFFMASAALGGGALLDESHFIDLMLWIFGEPSSVWGHMSRLSSLEIETDDNVDAVMRYGAGPTVSIHLDLFGRPHEKHIVAVGETGTLHWSFEPNQIRLGRKDSQHWQDETFAHERNDMFTGVAREFMDIIAGDGSPSCTIEDGCAVMRVIEAVRESTRRGLAITLEGHHSR
ncbi:MAG TPA: Gfo/Idh/MocA family oxidoreductase [Longimicrobiales bacterium]|nr:Gfo/Idh/MocA family oxidoreductase [Longimicrobiales bacterium]